jgi:predicted glycosyl hydrolase (DUF1957 family)
MDSETPAPSDGNYWTYWVHKVQELWKRIEEIEERLDALETEDAARPESGEPTETAPAPKIVSQEGRQSALAEKELTACMALKELGRPATLEEINSHLRTTRTISEGLRDTLMARLKGAVEKGYVGYSEADRTFSLARKTFLVE